MTPTPKQVADNWARAVAWNRERIEMFPSALGESAVDRDIAYARDLYVRDVIDVDEFERRVDWALKRR